MSLTYYYKIKRKIECLVRLINSYKLIITLLAPFVLRHFTNWALVDIQYKLLLLEYCLICCLSAKNFKNQFKYVFQVTVFAEKAPD